MPKLILLLGLSLMVASQASAEVKVEKIEYQGWHHCYRVSNGEIELVVTGDVGPRVMRFGFVGGQNLFKEFADQLGGAREEKHQLRGGDRVWKAPEDAVATWAPDNVPVEITITANGLIATAPAEPLTSLQKEIEVRMAASGTEGHCRSSHHQPFSLLARILRMGADHDGAGWHRHLRFSSARPSSREFGGHQSAGDVGVHESV